MKSDEKSMWPENAPWFMKATEKLYKRIYANTPPPSFSISEIFHYTNLESFLAMIQSDSLWLSDSRFLNDFKESKDGVEFCNKTLLSMAEKHTDPLFSRILLDTAKSLSQEDIPAPFVMSFSSQGDLLSQWRAYASDGKGISICFDPSLPKKKKTIPFWVVPASSFEACIYEDSEKEKLVDLLVSVFFENFRLDYERYGEKILSDYQSSIAVHLRQFSCYFKDKAFSEEKEYRIIFRNDCIKPSEIKFRSGKNFIIPYMVFGNSRGLEGHKLPITRVVIGPNSNQGILELGVRQALHHFGYNNVTISRSTIPYRN